MHHSVLDGREINVELTAGGGGRSEARMGKLAERRERVGGQRERKEVEGEGAEEGADTGSEQKGGLGMEKKRERGGKRVKNAPVSIQDFNEEQFSNGVLETGVKD